MREMSQCIYKSGMLPFVLLGKTAMTSIKDELIAEIQTTPGNLLPQVLKFLRGLKQTSASTELEPEGETWPPGFFEDVIGGWHGDPLMRAPQPEYPERDSLR